MLLFDSLRFLAAREDLIIQISFSCCWSGARARTTVVGWFSLVCRKRPLDRELSLATLFVRRFSLSTRVARAVYGWKWIFESSACSRNRFNHTRESRVQWMHGNSLQARFQLYSLEETTELEHRTNNMETCWKWETGESSLDVVPPRFSLWAWSSV